MTNPHLAYRADIDGLRALAILVVVAFHAYPEWLHGGFVGVDVFFVISGYLISGILLRGLTANNFSFTEFYARRIKRIFPALSLVLISCLVFGWFALLADEYKMLGKHSAAGAAFISNIFYWQEAGYFDKSAELKPLLHLWSLGIEEQFYIFWPVLLFFAHRFGFNLFRFISFFCLASFAVNVVATAGNTVFSFYLPLTRAWELLAGGLLAFFNLNKREGLNFNLLWLDSRLSGSTTRNTNIKLSNNLKSWLGLILVLIAAVGFNTKINFPGFLAAVPVLGAVLIISAGPHAWANKNLLASKLMVFLGLISYPLYLWHWPLLAFLRIIEPDASFTMRFSTVALSLLLAWLTYQLLEKYVRKNKSWFVTFTLLIIMLLIAGAGFNIYSRDGLGFRHKQIESQLEPLKWDEKDLNRQSDCLRDFKKLGMEGYCLRSSTAPISVALIGDSHANHLFYGLERFYSRLGQGLINLGSGGCPPFYDLESRNKKVGEVCQGKMNYVLDYVVSSPSIKTVVLSGSSIQYTSGDGPGNEMREGDFELRSIDGGATAQRNVEIFGRAMDQTLSRLQHAGKDVVFAIDIPEMGFDPRACFASSFMKLTHRLPKTPCATVKQDVVSRSQIYRAKVTEILNRFPSVKRWDPADYLCDEQYCWAVIDGKAIYRDAAHLSLEGSLYLGDHFSPK